MNKILYNLISNTKGRLTINNPSTDSFVSALNVAKGLATNNRLFNLADLLRLETYRYNYPKDFAKGVIPGKSIPLFFDTEVLNQKLSHGRCVLSIKNPEIKLISGFVPENKLSIVNKFLDSEMLNRGETSSLSDSGDLDYKVRNSRTLWINTSYPDVIPEIVELQERLESEILNFEYLISSGRTITHEQLQVVDYALDQHYLDHSDEDNFVSQPTRRITTCLLYLKSPKVGGNTHFKDLDISLSPMAGDLITFSYLTENEMVDPLTCHRGDPVYAGNKRIMTLWSHVNVLDTLNIKTKGYHGNRK